MKTYQSLKYLLFAGMIGVWGCSSQQYAQTGENDDLYFSSKDREQVILTASAKDYSNIENKGVASEDYSQKNVNPEYIQQYADQNRRESSGTNNNDSYSADDNSYYDENYSQNHSPIDLARDYNRYNNNRGTNINVFPSIGFGGFYGGPAFYDPFYDPFFGSAYYDPFFHRPFFGRPGWNINISYNYGWGNPWGWGRSAYWYDPFYNPYRSWGAWGDPFYNGFYGRPYYGWGGGWNRGGNVIVVNPSNDSRQQRYSPRSSRGSAVVNNDFNNTPRSTVRDSRGGRVDQTDGAAGTNPASGYANEGRRPSNISADESRPARAIRPRSDANPDYQPQNTQPANNSGNRNYSPNVNSGTNDGISTNPRAVRPRSNSESYQNQNSNNRYYDSNRSSAPTYNSTPSTGRSPRSYDNSRSNNNWNNNSSNDSYRSNSNSGFNNSNSGRSYSTPSQSSSPSSAPSRSSSGSSGSPRRSPR